MALKHMGRADCGKCQVLFIIPPNKPLGFALTSQLQGSCSFVEALVIPALLVACSGIPSLDPPPGSPESSHQIIWEPSHSSKYLPLNSNVLGTCCSGTGALPTAGPSCALGESEQALESKQSATALAGVEGWSLQSRSRN